MQSYDYELTWLRYLLVDLQVTNLDATQLYRDNQTTLHITSNPVFHECTKHIELDYHLAREKLQARQILTYFTPSHFQVVDILTKALGKASFHSYLHKLGIIDIYAPT